jgi:hypothetical protein
MATAEAEAEPYLAVTIPFWVKWTQSCITPRCAGLYIE